MNTTQHRVWCDDDEHALYENYVDFNEWIDGDEAEALRTELGISNLTQPSKALFASDKEAYDQTFKKFRNERRHEALNENYFTERFGNNHWFQRNLDHFLQLVNRIEAGDVVPFIGAGISVAGGFPTWEKHLREQGLTANLPEERIQELLDNGEYETVLEEIEAVRGKDVFVQEMKDVFSRNGSIPEAVWRISELFSDTLITTNYDHLLEQAFDNGESQAQVLNGKDALNPDASCTTIIMLHGDIRKPQHCILSQQQYDEAYGQELDKNLAIPRLLSYYYRNSSLLFLGCSLNTDRTINVFNSVKQSLKEEQELPQHFSIEQAPEDVEELSSRNSFLAKLGITPIWFQKNGYEYIDNILRLAKSEVNYRRRDSPVTTTPQTLITPSITLDYKLDLFLNDFIDVMPLLHWLHMSVPKSSTQRYLSAMQRVFHARSLFTQTLDNNLSSGLDNLLRALSNNSCFDGYTHGKLSIAFDYLQDYLQNRNLPNYVNSKNEWNFHELLNIPLLQLDKLINTDDRDINYHAIRLLVALLEHGKEQQSSPKSFCQINNTLTHEFIEYFTEALRTDLGITAPDRLDNFSNDNIRSLCKIIWDNYEKPFNEGIFQRLIDALPFGKKRT